MHLFQFYAKEIFARSSSW